MHIVIAGARSLPQQQLRGCYMLVLGTLWEFRINSLQKVKSNNKQIVFRNTHPIEVIVILLTYNQFILIRFYHISKELRVMFPWTYVEVFTSSTYRHIVSYLVFKYIGKSLNCTLTTL